MTTSLLMLADTHVPKRARELPAEVWDAVDRADVVVHAGDWVSAELLDQLSDRARVLHGVYGNNDGAELRARLPEIARWEVEGLRSPTDRRRQPYCSYQWMRVDDGAVRDVELVLLNRAGRAAG